jgi:hypothetical protein
MEQCHEHEGPSQETAVENAMRTVGLRRKQDEEKIQGAARALISMLPGQTRRWDFHIRTDLPKSVIRKSTTGTDTS